VVPRRIDPSSIRGLDTLTPPASLLQQDPEPDTFVSVVCVRAGAGYDVCGGRIGTDGLKFCSSQCSNTTKSCGRYRTCETKSDLSAPAYYIEHVKLGTAYIQPCLLEPEGGFSHEIVKLLSGSCTVSKWQDIFCVIQQKVDISRREIQELKRNMDHVLDEVASLRRDNANMRLEANMKRISFGGHHFHSSQSYEKFISDYLPSGYYGFCFDFVSLLECHRDYDRSTDEGLKNLVLIRDAGYNDTQQAWIDMSFCRVIPTLFGDRHEALNPAKKMGSLTSVDAWDHPASKSGLRYSIDEFLSGYEIVIKTQVTFMLGTSTIAGKFFIELIEHTVTFWRKYSAWVTDFERKMTFLAGADDPIVHKKSIWDLVCGMTYAMFKEMAERRSVGALSSRSFFGVDDTIKCAYILQGTLSAHKFMAELISAEFVRHPTFASIITEYLLTSRASQISMSTLQTKIKKLENRLEGSRHHWKKQKAHAKASVTNQHEEDEEE
jgi:hypothetical protein